MTLMDLLAIDTCVPAVTARGAIVEKGQKRCKAIGDYLNSSFAHTLWPHHKPLWERACSR